MIFLTLALKTGRQHQLKVIWRWPKNNILAQRRRGAEKIKYYTGFAG